MTVELEKKLDEMTGKWEGYKAENDKRIEEIKAKGFETAETKAKFEKMDKEMDELKGTIESLQTALNRKAANQGGESKNLSEIEVEHKNAFNAFMRKGDESGIHALQTKEMSVISAEDGGFLVPSEMSSEVVKRQFDTSIVRDIVSIQTISGSELEILEDLDEVESGWVAERQERTETGTAKLNLLKIPAHELYAMPAATQKFLEDASINVEAWLTEKMAAKFARDENAAVVNGDGEGKPKGFLTYADGNGVFKTIERQKTGVNAGFAADPNGGDAFIDLAHKLKQVYRANAMWAMNRATVAAVRKFKTSDGAYIWQPSLQAGKPETLVGLGIREMDDMLAPANFAAGSLAVALADFRAAYQMVDRRAISVLRDPYTKKGFVLFYSTKRVGGAVKNYDAIKILELSA